MGRSETKASTTASRREGRKRSRSRERAQKSRDGKRRRRSTERQRPDKTKASLDVGEIVGMRENDKDMAEQRLEEEMRKRRERIEQWRLQRKEQEDRVRADEDDDAAPAKKWSLEDDAEDDEEDASTGAVKQEVKEEPHADGAVQAEAAADAPTPPAPPPSDGGDEQQLNGNVADSPPEDAAVAEEDDDPLETFMREINKSIRPDTVPIVSKASTQKGNVVVVKKAKQSSEGKNKGVIMEQNADGLEYSDEETEFDMDKAMTSMASRSQKMGVTDHSRIYYRAFRKDFYVEVPELARMTDEEVAAFREEMECIKVKGKRCPKPIKNWAQSGVSRVVVDLLRRHEYAKPTPVQAQAIPAIMSGRDVIGIAKTGSGKTLAFLLPMLRHVLDQPPLDELDGPIALVLAPTRELCMQTGKECQKFARHLNVNAVCVYGGAGISDQIAGLKRGAEIVLCTPGRLIDLLAANNGRVTNLRRVTYLVLDEADRMFDMGFEPQVTRIISNIRPDRQTVLFSATFPRQMEALARKILQKPIEIQVGGRSVVCKDIEQHVVICEEHQKFLKLLELLGVYWEHGNVLVFVEKQEKADELVGDLMKAGYNCAPLHGAIDQFDRGSTILDFKSAKIKLLVATSVAARGLDVKKLILVVNYDCPNHYEDYVHRVGRTGRAGNKGYSYTFILPEGQERVAGDIVKAFELAEAAVPEELQQLWDEYTQRMETEGKAVQKLGGGFGGHGYRFDDAEAEATASKRSMVKLVHGIEADGDNDDEMEQQIATIMKSKKRVMEGGRVTSTGKAAGGNAAALEKAKEMARKIALEKNIGASQKDATQQTAEAVMRGDHSMAVGANISSKSVAHQLADQLNARLNYIPDDTAAPVEEAAPLSLYEEELEINDFPQQVRWRVCSKETLSLIMDYGDVGIQVKGSFIPPGKKPKEFERKLFLCIESTTEIGLNRAKAEIIRVLKEAMKNLAAQGQQGPRGRYKIV